MLLFLTYNLAGIILLPFYILVLGGRLICGKEDTCSLKSRFSLYNAKRLARKLIWVHAASVGESLIAINIIDKLKKKHPSYGFLITTGTLSSAKIIRKWLPEGVSHEFTPIDIFWIVGRFYQYWQPVLGIFIESDLWPALVRGSASRCKLLLINARLSDKSFRRWQKFSKIFRVLTSFFSSIAAQSKTDLEKYHSLGCASVNNLGNLKFANKKLPVRREELAELQKIFVSSRVLVAASTHPEDEQVILDIIRRAKGKYPNFYPIIILRHPERAGELKSTCQKLGLKCSFRSTKKYPDLKDDLYVVDSLGELGLFYSIAHIAFIGGSFKRGGHNLLEAAYFNNIIILGPDMSNFKNITDEMLQRNACVQAKNAHELEEKIMFFLDEKNAELGIIFSANAMKYVSGGKEIMDSYLSLIDNYLG